MPELTTHVLTVHWRDAKWLRPQLRQLRRHVRNARLYAALEHVDPSEAEGFDVVVELTGTHAEKLNTMAELALRDAEPDDLLLFVDGDAFPIADVEPSELLRDVGLAAVQRAENLGDVQPHPCFCLVPVSVWKEVGGDWQPGATWTNSLGEEVTDVGGNLLAALRAHDVAWRPLLRTPLHDLHPIHFGVYERLAYHHGAGFRRWKVTRVETAARGVQHPLLVDEEAFTPAWLPVLGRLERRWRRSRARTRARELEAELSPVEERIWRAVEADEDLIRVIADIDAERAARQGAEGREGPLVP